MKKLLLLALLVVCGFSITNDELYDDSWALIIGINKYEYVSNLDYAVQDALSISKLLTDKFYFPSKNINVLTDEQATLENIKNSLAEISMSAKENDRVLIYFAGHGVTMDLPDGGEMGYLLPIDGKEKNLFSTGVPMDDLKKISSMSKSKHMLFLIDACYGGLAATGARGLVSTDPHYIKKITNDKSRQIITAGGKGEQVIEKSEWGHSAFTLNLLRALDDGKADLNYDGYITADELGLFLKEKVTIDSENQQTPQSRRFTSHEGEFIFINQINNLIINNNELNLSDTSNVDYEMLATMIAKKMKKNEKTQPKKSLESKTRTNNALNSKQKKGITIMGAISSAQVNQDNLLIDSEGTMINMMLDNVMTPFFNIEKQFDSIILGVGYYGGGYSTSINTVTLNTKINYINFSLHYPYKINENLSVSLGGSLGIPTSGHYKLTAPHLNNEQGDFDLDDLNNDMNVIINSTYALTETYGVRFYYQHGLLEIQQIGDFAGMKNRLMGIGLSYEF